MTPCKLKSHIQYKNKAGKNVVGVTTALGVLNKPALVAWAWNLGKQGIDWRKFRDDKADIGTLAHYLIMCHLTDEKPDTSDYSKNQIDLAENCILSYFEWEKTHPIKPILTETPLVSESHQFGGTCDIYAELNGQKVLIDIKTGKGIYDEYAYQVAAYKILLNEAEYNVDYAMILNVGRNEDEEFQTKTFMNLDIEKEIFLNCLAIYKLKKEKPNA